MAGAGYKLFNTGDVLTAAQVNTYLQEQVVMVFANATARTTALSGVLAEGMVSYLKDTNATEVYDGSAWVGIGNSGDITGVTAGTGISGGGTSGTVTITNSMATEITAAGDIVIGTGSGTFDNLPIGTTGQVLTADTTVSPYKVKWASASSTPTFVGCRLYSSSAQNLTNNTATAINFDLENFDSDGFHSTSTNNTRITIPSGKAGKYLFTGHGEIQSGGGNMRYSTVRKNGSTNIDTATAPSNASARANVVVTAIADCAVGDYFELVLQQDSGGTIVTYDGTSSTSFGCTFLGA